MAIKIVTDSTSYIPKKYIEKYDISVVSLNILLKNKLFFAYVNKWNWAT